MYATFLLQFSASAFVLLITFCTAKKKGCVCVRVCLSVCVCNCCILYIAKSVARLCVLFFRQVELVSRDRNRGSQLRQRQRQMPAGIHFGLFRSVSRSQTIDRQRERERACMLTLPVMLSFMRSFSLYLSLLSWAIFGLSATRSVEAEVEVFVVNSARRT